MSGRSRGRTAAGYAATLGGAYVVTAGLYIVVSGHVAADIASSFEELHDIELYKGLAFVVVTGALLFLLAYALFRRLLRSTFEVAQSREAILRADRQVLPGLLAASIAHDFKNALAVAQTNATLLAEDPTADERKEILQDLASALDHASALARDLSKAGSSSASGEAKDVDVRSVVADAVEFVRHHPHARARTLRFERSEPLPGRVFPTLVHQIVSNLVLNALDAVAAGGHVAVHLDQAGDALVLEVHDDGPGLAPNDESRIFDPFFTTKPDGTGLGLVSVRTCAQLHRGDVTAGRSSELGGALFRVTLRPPESGGRGAHGGRIEPARE
ncbi:MAG: HAMP domain-containing sensor histidine kinase [Polyangiaceae bacterium]